MLFGRSILFGRLVVALFAMFAFGAIAASAAQAEEAPHWVIEGKKLETNKTRLVTIRAYNGTTEPITLESEVKSLGIKVTIECHLAKAGKGAILAGGEPGTGELSSEFSDCAQKGNGVSPCTVEEPIPVNPVKLELVRNTALTTYLIEFDQSKTEEFANIKFKGAGCAVKEAKVTGLVLGLVRCDPSVSGKEEEAEVTEATPEFPSFLVRFPDPTTKVWLWTNGVHKEFEITPLTFKGEPATLSGKVLILLANANGETIKENFAIRG
jgi:hypothetical protein